MGIRRLSKDERVDFRQKVMDALLAQPIFEGFKYIKADEAIVTRSHLLLDAYESYSRNRNMSDGVDRRHEGKCQYIR